MPYITQLPDSFAEFNGDFWAVNFGDSVSFGNLNNQSQEFSQYDIDSNTGTSLSNGDNIATVDADGNTTASGTYLGDVRISTAAFEVGIPGLFQVGVAFNPIEGDLMVDESGNLHALTEDELSDDHLGVQLSFTVLGQEYTVGGDNLSDAIDGVSDVLNGIPIVGPGMATLWNATAGTTADLIQAGFDTALVTMEYDDTGTLDLTDDQVVPCFCAGALIQTQNGQVPVEKLSVGDMILTRDNGLQPIRWIGSTRISTDTLKRNPNLRPIRIKAGALGKNTPSSDLLVSPQHRVLVRSKVAVKMFGAMEILVAAKQLLQKEGIDYAEDMTEVEYVHFLFDQHEVVISNGAETESLYTGPMALKSVGKAARHEIFALFPELANADHAPEAARPIPSGRKSRKLAQRHVQHNRDLVC